MKTGYRIFALFTISSIAFLLHQYLQKIAGTYYAWIDSYLDPLLFLPILLPLIVWERRLIRRIPDYTLPGSHILGYVILISILCEILLPLWNERMTADIWDVFFYAAGGLIYALLAALDKKSTERTLRNKSRV